MRTALIKARAQVKKEGINNLLKTYGVRDRQSLMLQVLFNVVHNQCVQQAISTKDDDYKQRLAYQRAVFELAAAPVKIPSTDSTH